VKTDRHKMIGDKLLSDLPKFLRGFIFGLIAKGVRKSAEGQGITRHTDAEIFDLGLDDVKAIEMTLGDKDFILADKPAEVDATAYAFLHGMAAEVFPTPIQAHIRSSEKLMAYLDRMDALVFEG